MWNDGRVLCGEPQPVRIWYQEQWTQSLPHWRDLLCRSSFDHWRNPLKRAARR